MTSVSQATQLIYQRMVGYRGLPVELDLAQASGRVLAEDIRADRSYPPYDRCMMDGICFASLSPRYQLVGTLHAGDSCSQTLSRGQAWRINTGAAVPADCDTVAPVEELEFSGDTVTIRAGYTPVPNQFIHPLGSDVRAGEIVLRQGQVLGSAALSIAASVGATRLSVIRSPKVFVLTTGKEAIPPEETPSTYQIRRSHATALQAALSSLGVATVEYLHLSDDLESMRATIAEALQRAELIITCGAISKGTSDYLGQILREQLGEPVLHGVAQRPGKPLAFWAPTSTSPPVFALPGNALSTLITFHRYVAPALRDMMGAPSLPLSELMVEHELPSFPLTRFLPVRIHSATCAELVNPQNSGDFSQLAGTDGFVEIPPTPAQADGTASTYSYYPWL